MVKNADREEFKGCLIDTLEDFCDTAGIDIANAEKESSVAGVHIYGTDYDKLGGIVENFYNGVIPKENLSTLLIASFLGIITERGVFSDLQQKLEETVEQWSECIEVAR